MLLAAGVRGGAPDVLDAQRSQARNLHVAKSRRVAKSREAKPLSRVRRGGVGGLPLPGDAGIPGAPRSESRGGLWPRGALGAAVRGLAGAASPRLSTRHAAKRGGAASVLFLRFVRISRSASFRQAASSREKPRSCWCPPHPAGHRLCRLCLETFLAGTLGRDGEARTALQSAWVWGFGPVWRAL